MQVMHIHRTVLLFTLLAAGMTLGCSISESSDGAGGGPCTETASTRCAGDDEPLPEKIPHTYCPPYTLILKGTIDGAPYDLTAECGLDVLDVEGGYVNIFLPDGDFIYIGTEGGLYTDRVIPVVGNMELPNTSPSLLRYTIGTASKLYTGPDYSYFDFHLWLSGRGELTGCVDGFDPPAPPPSDG